MPLIAYDGAEGGSIGAGFSRNVVDCVGRESRV